MIAPFPKILFGAVALFTLVYAYALVISPQADTGLKYASQVGKALLLYQADYDARLPVASTWMDDIDRYTSKTILMGNPQSIPGTRADAPWVGMNRLASGEPHYAFEESAVLAFSSAQPRWNSNGGPEALGPLKNGKFALIIHMGTGVAWQKADADLDWNPIKKKRTAASSGIE